LQYNDGVMERALVARWRTLCLVLLGAFLGMAVIVYGVRLLPGDADLHQEILTYRGTTYHAVARWLNYGGKWHFLAPAMAALLIALPAARPRWWLWCGLLPASGAVEQLVKFLVARPRPRGVNWGFPSGHVTAAATFAVVLAYLLTRERVSPGARAVLLVLAVVLVGGVGFARIVLNAHWPSDVLGGILLGAGCAAAGAWWDAAHPAASPAPAGAVDRPVRIGG
jgi:undecaprenyl-diphosphatase